MPEIGNRTVRHTAIVAMALLLMAIATSAQSKAFRVRFDPLFNAAFSAAVSQTVGWSGSAFISVDESCLIPGSIQTVGSCGSASLEGGSLFFYDTSPANGIGGISWTGLFPAPNLLSIDAFGNVDGMEFAAAPLTSAGFNAGWPNAYDVALTFTLDDGPSLTLSNGDTSYASARPQDGEDYVPSVTWTAISEPGSLALVGAALGVAGLVRRRRH